MKIRIALVGNPNSGKTTLFNALTGSSQYVKVGKEMIEAKFIEVSPAVENADSYFELSFKSGAGVIAPGSDSGDIQLRVTKSGVPYTQSNDYSYDKATSFTENSKITAYVNSELVYGEQPDGVVGPIVTPTPTPNDYIIGDVNGDEEVDSIDFAVMRQILLGIINQFPYEKGELAGDLDGNGVFDSLDFAHMRKYMLGYIKEFPIEK
jgi:endoglucanase